MSSTAAPPALRLPARRRMTYDKVGPFKAMFATYFLERFCHSRTVQLQAMAELDQIFLAGWGAGRALAAICPNLAAELPCHQRDQSAINRRKCTLLVGMLYYTMFGEAMAAIVRPCYKRASARWGMLHLEFILCEIRKGGSRRGRVYRHPGAELIQKYAGRTREPEW